MMVFRAVENRRYLVRAANTGISAVVAPDGRIIANSGLFERTAVTATIAANTGITPYARYGDTFGWSVTLGVAIAIFLAFVRAQVGAPRLGLLSKEGSQPNELNIQHPNKDKEVTL
jgi:apolipoprotein N-acyltransferase